MKSGHSSPRLSRQIHWGKGAKGLFGDHAQSTYHTYRRVGVFTYKVHGGMEDIRQFPYTMLGSMTGSPCLCMKVSGHENRFGFTLGLQG